MRAAAVLALAAMAASASMVHAQPLPRSSLRVQDAAGWTTWWRSDSAPARWGAKAPLASRIAWRDEGGVAWGELLLAGDGEAWRTKLVVARLDPRRVRLELDTAFARNRAAWRVDRMSQTKFADVILAVNAGQFVETLPWGWVVIDGQQYLPPSSGPLSTSLVVDAAGVVRWHHGGAPGDSSAHPVVAFQSYPTLLVNGDVPDALRAPSAGVNVSHRDARLAIGSLATGELVLALTRFDGLGDALGSLPFGITTPEMAAVMGALGARDAVMLDGGISAQLLVRGRDGQAIVWRGLRAVPLALLARRR